MIVAADDDVTRLGEHPGQGVDPEQLAIEERDPYAPPVFRCHHRPPDPWEPQRVVDSEVSRAAPKVNRRSERGVRSPSPGAGEHPNLVGDEPTWGW